jgi:hypothetical protein
VKKTIRGLSLLATATLAVALAPCARAEEVIVIQPHRALYDISLRSAKSATGIADIHGQMFYDLQASCTEWTTTHRFVLTYDYIDNPHSEVVSEFKTVETRDGRKFTFEATRVKDGEPQEEIAGIVQRPTKAGKVFQASYSKPEQARIKLAPETLFPVAHTRKVISGALKGQKFISGQLFDGSDADGPYQVSGLVLKPISEPERKREWPRDVDKKLASQGGWRTQVAIFPNSQEKESASDYEMDVNLLANGVVTDMTIRYADFAIAQSLKALSANPEPDCTPSKTPEVKKP